jgi:hypothetical protein
VVLSNGLELCISINNEWSLKSQHVSLLEQNGYFAHYFCLLGLETDLLHSTERNTLTKIKRLTEVSDFSLCYLLKIKGFKLSHLMGCADVMNVVLNGI